MHREWSLAGYVFDHLDDFKVLVRRIPFLIGQASVSSVRCVPRFFCHALVVSCGRLVVNSLPTRPAKLSLAVPLPTNGHACETHQQEDSSNVPPLTKLQTSGRGWLGKDNPGHRSSPRAVARHQVIYPHGAEEAGRSAATHIVGNAAAYIREPMVVLVLSRMAFISSRRHVGELPEVFSHETNHTSNKGIREKRHTLAASECGKQGLCLRVPQSGMSQIGF